MYKYVPGILVASELGGVPVHTGHSTGGALDRSRTGGAGSTLHRSRAGGTILTAAITGWHCRINSHEAISNKQQANEYKQ